jgi:hypothetical protein
MTEGRGLSVDQNWYARIALSGELSLEEAMDLSHDRLRDVVDDDDDDYILWRWKGK